MAAIATPQGVLDARDTTTQGMVLVNGVTVQHIEWDARFSVASAYANASVTLSLPRPEVVQANATVQIQGGYDDYVRTLFSGRLPRWQSSMRREDTITLYPVGWCSLLAYRERFDLVFDGPITISALFDALCARRGVPSYRADRVTDETGTIEIELGTNPSIDDGKVIIPASQSPLAYLNNQAEIYKYRIYDTCDGTVRLSRISGMPLGDPVVTFQEGWSILGADRDYDISDIVNYPDIHGRTFEDALGASVPIRAFPDPVVSSPFVPVNDGVSYQRITSSLITTQQQAEIALAAAQVDMNAPHTPVQWDAVAVPGLNVGDHIALDAQAVEGTGSYWLTDMRIQGRSSGSLTATYNGWAGGGVAMPAGENREFQLIQTGVVHLGDETLTHYASPAPNGNVSNQRQKWTITIPERTTAVSVIYWHHGTNSQLVGGVQTDLEVSKFSVFEVGANRNDDDVRAVTSGTLEILSEDLARRYPYSQFTTTTNDDGEIVALDPGYWKPGAANLDRLDAGTYDLYLDAGEKNGWDDFEARLLYLVFYGRAEPVIVPQETI
jgi:hypothetical protein